MFSDITLASLYIPKDGLGGMGLELDILNGIHGMSSPVMDSVMQATAYVTAHGAIWVLLSCILICTRRYRYAGVAMLVCMFVGEILCDGVLKPMICRERPVDLADFELLVEPPSSYSFPSGHSVVAFSAATALFLFHRREGIVLMLCASFVAFSRLYLFVHWPTDVVAGALIGMIVSVLTVWFLRRYIPFFREGDTGDVVR